MSQRKTNEFIVGLALATLIVTGPVGSRGDQPQKTPPNKDAGKQPNTLQALQDAFSKGVSVTAVDPKDLPRQVTEAATKNAPGASIKKAQKREIRHTMKYVALDKPR